jgi:hypothetical protein
MATLVKSKNRIGSKIQAKKKPNIEDDTTLDDEPEVKEGATVVVSSGLATLCRQWESSIVQGKGYWLKIVRYCIDNETSKEELKEALITIRNMKPLTAANEVSKIGKAVEHPELVRKAEKGQLTIEALREQVTKKQEGSTKPDVQLRRSLKRIAMFGIQTLDLDVETFIGEAEEQFKEAQASVDRKNKGETEADGSSDESAEFESDEGEVEDE